MTFLRRSWEVRPRRGDGRLFVSNKFTRGEEPDPDLQAGGKKDFIRLSGDKGASIAATKQERAGIKEESDIC